MSTGSFSVCVCVLFRSIIHALYLKWPPHNAVLPFYLRLISFRECRTKSKSFHLLIVFTMSNIKFSWSLFQIRHYNGSMHPWKFGLRFLLLYHLAFMHATKLPTGDAFSYLDSNIGHKNSDHLWINFDFHIHNNHLCPYCGNRKFYRHVGVEKLYPFRWLCWKRTGRIGMPQLNKLYLINFMNELCAPLGGISTQWPMDRIQHATIFVWFSPHEIWLQSKSRNETTSANRQEIQGLDLVVPQRIDALCSILCFAFVFKWMLRI